MVRDEGRRAKERSTPWWRRPPRPSASGTRRTPTHSVPARPGRPPSVHARSPSGGSRSDRLASPTSSSGPAAPGVLPWVVRWILAHCRAATIGSRHVLRFAVPAAVAVGCGSRAGCLIPLRAGGHAPTEGGTEPPDDLAGPAGVSAPVGRPDDVADRHPRVAGRLRVSGRSARPRPALGHPAVARLHRCLRPSARLPPDAAARGPSGGVGRGRDRHRTRPVRLIRRSGRREHERVQRRLGDHDRHLVAALCPHDRPRRRRCYRGRRPSTAPSPASSSGSPRPSRSPRSTTSTRAWARCSPTGSATRSQRPACSASSFSRSHSGRGDLRPQSPRSRSRTPSSRS